MSLTFVDIHTHHPASISAVSIRNLDLDQDTLPLKGWFSLGIHPWHIRDDGSEQLTAIRNAARSLQVLAIGECGLDKASYVPFHLQETVFQQQLHLAAALDKPVVIHCVRSWDEVLVALGKAHLTKPVIFHGFRKGLPLAERIIKEGHYLSFGAGLEQEAVRRVICSIPPERFFLETDSLPCSIETIYERAALATGIDLNSLSLQLIKNVTAVFGSTFLSL